MKPHPFILFGEVPSPESPKISKEATIEEIEVALEAYSKLISERNRPYIENSPKLQEILL